MLAGVQAGVVVQGLPGGERAERDGGGQAQEKVVA
jgi:hypothetical protein